MFEAAFISEFHFLRPEWFLLLIPYAVVSVVQWRSGDLARQWQPVIAEHLLNRMVVPGNQRQLLSPLWVSVVVVPLLVLALAGPSWTRGESPFAVDSAALVIAVDLSESMSGQDLQPDRLQRARSKILELARARGDAYTALVAYAGSGHTVLPLSDDPKVLLHYLDALQVGMLPRRGKAPETILPMARELLEEGGGTLLIIGDGATDVSAEGFRAVREEAEIQVVVWGMGKTQEQLDQDRARGLERSVLPLNESGLQALADAAGGSYQQVSLDDTDVAEILRQIDRHFELSGDSSRPWVDGGYYFAWPVALLFLLWFRKGWALRW
ncbi:vWA domain-containing protein [Coraliomargarita akajimensis]|uniref:Ssl1 domain protein n=1 Tax=Coraliomargarita akajimensis (strain DSM 45221 / IAM 15411 / JCM 23193 / KCTC 12865 / 04OKA010-24) TaxID=583355 RepID=D5EJW4_CORAD|nr:VWA domain-containing protein [Coraliomargarita akajimensis]ADE54713.1 Ssl1 domain protein [Coraliomargarita akajimensis DSM 45221]